MSTLFSFNIRSVAIAPAKASLPASLLMSLLLAAGTAAAATLEGISHSALPGDRVQIRLKLSEPVANEPLSFTIDNPARIAIDLPDTTVDVENRTQNIGVGSAQSITAVEAEDRTRIVINLAQLVPYELSTSGNTIALTLDSVPASLQAESAPLLPTMPGAA
ncbi:MAG: AMIN domain-containing protein, partial [Gammaproteobacteria bacterium]